MPMTGAAITYAVEQRAETYGRTPETLTPRQCRRIRHKMNRIIYGGRTSPARAARARQMQSFRISSVGYVSWPKGTVVHRLPHPSTARSFTSNKWWRDA